VGTKINNVWEKVLRIYDTFTKKFACVHETWGFLNNLYWWPILWPYYCCYYLKSIWMP